jgi:plasmid stabilization system protein ParE
VKYQVELHPKAAAEINDIFNWYEERSPGLGRRFLEALSLRVTELSIHPDRYPVKKYSFRAIATKVFPYIIIYEVLTG